MELLNNLSLSSEESFSSSSEDEDDIVSNNAAKTNTNVHFLEKYSQQIKTSTDEVKSARIEKDKSDRATVENAIDPKTFKQLQKYITNGTLTKIDGCLSTGKEANIYYGINEETGLEVAIKVYKTSVLVFKDRERYINGEFRFKNFRNSNKINARKLIKVWSEKEFRNLKRLKQNGLKVPEPIHLRSNILMMEFLGDKEKKGWPSKKLKDFEFQDKEEAVYFYRLVLANMRLMYQKCRLIHADLSEYNMIVHENTIYIIDVSQSIEPSHPMALDFLRMDIKNVNDYFERKRNLEIYMEKEIFKFITEDSDVLFKGLEYDDEYNVEFLVAQAGKLRLKLTEEDEKEDTVFRSIYLIRDLNSLEEEDFDKFQQGKIDVFKSLVADKETTEPGQSKVDGTNDVGSHIDGDEESNSDSDSDSASDFESDEDKKPKGKKYEDKDEKKLRKQRAKEEKQEKRKTKMKKHVKQKLIKKTKK